MSKAVVFDRRRAHAPVAARTRVAQSFSPRGETHVQQPSHWRHAWRRQDSLASTGPSGARRFSNESSPWRTAPSFPAARAQPLPLPPPHAASVRAVQSTALRPPLWATQRQRTAADVLEVNASGTNAAATAVQRAPLQQEAAQTGSKRHTLTIKTEIRKPDPQAGVKSLQTITLDTANGKASSTYETGVTTVLGVEFDSRVDDFNVSELSGQDGVFSCAVDGTTGSKFFPADIDYAFHVTMNENTKEIGISGSHDGYPSYTMALDGAVIYDHQQGDLGDLLGDGDDVKVELNKPY